MCLCGVGGGGQCGGNVEWWDGRRVGDCGVLLIGRGYVSQQLVFKNCIRNMHISMHTNKLLVVKLHQFSDSPSKPLCQNAIHQHYVRYIRYII